MNPIERFLLGAVSDQLEMIQAELRAVKAQGVQLMTKADDANAKLDRINTAATNIAADIRSLKAEPGMTQAEAVPT